MSTFENLANELESILCTVSNFKIGKTNQNIVDCYNDNYVNCYSHYKVIAYSKSLNTIEDFEMYLLQRFKDLNACDNIQLDDTELGNAKHYILYLMYNN